MAIIIMKKNKSKIYIKNYYIISLSLSILKIYLFYIKYLYTSKRPSYKYELLSN